MKSLKTLSVKGLTLATLSMATVIAIIQPAVADYQWVTARNGYVPPGAVQGGFDGENLYVCSIGGSIGKLAPGHRKCYVPYGGREIGYGKYQVLVVDRGEWVPLTGNVPKGAVIGGKDGEMLYVCNAVVAGKWTPGKYPVSHDVCYVPYGGKEIGVRNFNVFISR
jgi:hypothetical protein